MQKQKSDARFMALALSLGRRGMGRVWPNPAVGCVIVRDGVIVGRGRTADGGRPHAETEALCQAGDKARGATAYVSLEPCSHHGKTPPCANALIDAGIAEVVVATGDPNPQVSGAGIAMLEAAGIAVRMGILKEQADADHAGFFLKQTRGRPYITLKLATTLDGHIATTTGDSQWITGPQARRLVHAMRARHDAVMVGAGTVRADDPMLDVRDMGAERQPVRVVISSDLNLPTNGKLARTAKDQPVWLCHSPAADARDWKALGAHSILAKAKGSNVDLSDAMGQLAGAGLTRIFCEGGGQLAASLMKAGLVDELVLFNGPKVIGGDGMSALGTLGVTVLENAPRFELLEHRAIGGDVMSRWRVA